MLRFSISQSNFFTIFALLVIGATKTSGFRLQSFKGQQNFLNDDRSRRKIILSSSSSSSSAARPLIPALDPTQRKAPPGAEILSKDPLIYTIPNLLSPQECNYLLNRAEELEQERPMKQSNPPSVSLDIKKLWPLPLLSLGAGIPPILRNYEQTSSFPPIDEAMTLALPPIVIAWIFTTILCFVAVPVVQRVSNESARTSLAMAWNQEEDIPFVQTLVDRVCEATNHSWQDWEAPVFTKYPPGSVFSRHSDASPTKGSEWNEEGGQRVVTCICYLNDVPKGGETSFDQLNIAVPPKQGNAVIFFPSVVGNSLEADERLTHESMAVLEGEKCIVQMFGRVGPRVPPPLGLPDSYGNQN